MKVRTGFVSNSSTSSFVCVFIGVLLTDFAERRRFVKKRTKYHEDTGKPYEVEDVIYRTYVGEKDITDETPEHCQQEALEYQIHEWLRTDAERCSLTTFSHNADGYPGCYVGMPIVETRELNEIVGFPDPSVVQEKMAEAKKHFESVGYQGPIQLLLLTETSS